MKNKKLKFMIFLVVAMMIGGMMTMTASAQVKFALTSPVFQHNERMPIRYTCEGDDVNPPLAIAGIPDGTKSLALIVDDPDAPGGMWVHWVVYNIPLVSEIKENSVPGSEGVNDFRRSNYDGPCPPSGTHRYFFKLYALDSRIPEQKGMGKKDLERAMKDHILAETNLMGLYQKQLR